METDHGPHDDGSPRPNDGTFLCSRCGDSCRDSATFDFVGSVVLPYKDLTAGIHGHYSCGLPGMQIVEESEISFPRALEPDDLILMGAERRWKSPKRRGRTASPPNKTEMSDEPEYALNPAAVSTAAGRAASNMQFWKSIF